MIQIYHNNRCSKSRECVLHFKTIKQEVEIINYLQKPPSEFDIKELLVKLNIKAIELVRTNEKLWNDSFSKRELSENEIITILSENPKLIQRPIVINGKKAVIARPLEEIKQII